MVNYEEEKLKFVSNLSGTSLYELISQLTLIPLIYFMSVLIKGTFLFGTSSNLVSSAQNVNLKSKPLNLFMYVFFILIASKNVTFYKKIILKQIIFN